MGKIYLLTFLFLFLVSFKIDGLQASEVDKDLLESLKSEANHNYNRLKSFKDERKNNKIFDDEREKSIAQFLEEQEKWDLIRERGLAEYRKEKRQMSPVEGGPEHKEDQRRRRLENEAMEKARQVQVTTRKRAQVINDVELAELESEELGLKNNRPRFDLRKRGQNKWVKSGGNIRGSGGGSGYIPAPMDADAGFPPPPVDYVPAPPPVQEFEEPPPPPPVYDSGMYNPGFDGGYGDIPPPPPPPPPTEFDF